MTHVNVDVQMVNQDVSQQQLNIASVSVGVPAEAFVEVSQAAYEARLSAEAARHEIQTLYHAAAAECTRLVRTGLAA